LNKIFYRGKKYDLSKTGEREDLVSLSEFSRNVTELATKWLSGGKEFSFQTSGSTGEFKEISHSREKIQKSAKLTISYFNLNKDDNALLVLDPTRIAGAMMIIRSLVAGMDLYAIDPTSDLTSFSPIFRDCNFAAIVPLQLEKLLLSKEVSEIFRNYKAVLVGGATVNYAMIEKLKGMALPFYETFGMTETVTHFALRKLSGSDTNPFEVIGNHIVRQDSHGCMIVEGDLTGNQPLSTHDIIHIRDERHFEWVGRSDFIINTGGIKISPEELERKIAGKIYAFGIRNRFIISSVHDESLGEKIILVFEGTRISDHIISELMKTIKEDLDKYECPKEIRYIEKFPEAAISKINRRAVISILA